MIEFASQISRWACKQLESSLLPTEGGLVTKAATYSCQFFKFGIFLPVAITTSCVSFGLSRIFSRGQADPPLIAFAKNPKWSERRIERSPIEIGFATADFQENGPAQHPNTNWGQHYRQNAQNLGNITHVPDLWNHPERMIQILEDMGVKKFRFSISRDKIEPELGHFDTSALDHYRQFCRMLVSKGIEPMVTLQHFSDPLYFSWEDPSQIYGFVRYAQIVGQMLYEEGVRKIVTINEPTVVAFQGYINGEFPPNRTMDFKSAGRVLENMMKAHCEVYRTLKEQHPDFQIGISHDPIRFRHFHKVHPLWSPIEKILCHYLTEINHNAFMRFFQTGKFSLKVPFKANHTFELRERPPLDFIGLQYYTDPLLKLSFTGGGSVTRNPKERLSAYGYRMYPQGLASAIEECRKFGVPIDLTEIGLDTGVNSDQTENERILYFDRILQVVQEAQRHGANVRTLHLWTARRNLEWHKGWGINSGFYNFDPSTGRSTPLPSGEWVKKIVRSSH